MDISERLRCLFSAEIEQRGGSYVVEIPEREVDIGEVREHGTYQVALLATDSAAETDTVGSGDATERRRATTPEGESGARDPPVTVGETRQLEIEDIGDQGDGIARVERGFVVVVPDAGLGDQVTAEITGVGESVAFAEIQGPQPGSE